jgi:N-acyl-D-amino-acid deacylase
MKRPSRRTLLASLGAAMAGLAGCSNDGSGTATPPSAPTDSPMPSPTPTPTATATATPTATESQTATETPTDTATATPAEIPATGPPTAGVDAFDAPLRQFLQQWELPGATVAVMEEGKLAFARGYGFAGPDTDEPVDPGALFRIGSLSKPVTAVAVLNLVEQGDLALDDRALDILSDLVPDGGPADPRASEITVGQLLRHTSGWTDAAVGFDPVFAPRQVAEAQGTETPASAETTVEFVLTQDLGFDPGTSYAYTNVNYCVLGRVIEEVTGEDYETHVRNAVLNDLGATRMHLGATREADLHEDEVRYLSRATVKSPFPGEGEVPRPYGVGVLDEALDADGGWVGSSVDLLRFVRGIDGRDGVPDVLDEGTRETMTERPDVSQWQGANQYYGAGWFVIPGQNEPSLWHNGSLPGSYGFLIRYGDDDRTLAALFNGRSPDAQVRQFNVRAQQTFMGAYDSVSSWPDRDLFQQFE